MFESLVRGYVLNDDLDREDIRCGGDEVSNEYTIRVSFQVWCNAQ